MMNKMNINEFNIYKVLPPFNKISQDYCDKIKEIGSEKQMEETNS